MRVWVWRVAENISSALAFQKNYHTAALRSVPTHTLTPVPAPRRWQRADGKGLAAVPHQVNDKAVTGVQCHLLLTMRRARGWQLRLPLTCSSLWLLGGSSVAVQHLLGFSSAAVGPHSWQGQASPLCQAQIKEVSAGDAQIYLPVEIGDI